MAIKSKKKASGGSGGSISLKPKDAQGGAFGPDNFVGKIDKARWRKETYDGKVDPHLSLHLWITPDGDEQFEEAISAGKLERLVPSEKGHGLAPAEGSEATGISDNSNAYLFLNDLCSKGFPESNLGNDIAVIEGVRAKFLRKPQPERDILGSENEDGEAAAPKKAKKRTYLSVTKVLSVKGKKVTAADKDTDDEDDAEEADEKPAKKAKAKAVTKKKAKGPNVGPEAAKLVRIALKKSGGKMDRAKLTAAIAKAVKGNASAKAIMDMIADDEWLGENAVLKGGVVKLAKPTTKPKDEDEEADEPEEEESDEDSGNEDEDEEEESDDSDDDEEEEEESDDDEEEEEESDDEDEDE